jgi:hypothetical protein
MATTSKSTLIITEDDARFYAQVVLATVRARFIGSDDEYAMNQALGLMHALFGMTAEGLSMDTESISDYCGVNRKRLSELFTILNELKLLDRAEDKNILGRGVKYVYFFPAELLERVAQLRSASRPGQSQS